MFRQIFYFFTLFSLAAYADAPPGYLDHGSPEASSISYRDMTPAGIQKIIRQEIKQHCNEEGLCKIYGVKRRR